MEGWRQTGGRKRVGGSEEGYEGEIAGGRDSGRKRGIERVIDRKRGIKGEEWRKRQKERGREGGKESWRREKLLSHKNKM